MKETYLRFESAFPLDQDETVTHEAYSSQENEKALLILNSNTGVAHYTHEFVHGFIDSKEISGVISAISRLNGELNGVDYPLLRTQFGDGTTLLVESGEWAIAILAVYRESNELRSKLKTILKEFEDTFPTPLDSDETERFLFNEFDRFVRRVLVMDRLNERTTIVKDHNWAGNKESLEEDATPFKLSRLMLLVETGQTIAEVSQRQKIPLDEVIDLISHAYWNNWVHLNFVPSDTDILTLTEGSLSFLMRNENPSGISTNTLKLVASLDGRTPLANHLYHLDNGEIVQLLVELGDLLSKGYLSRISIERRLVFVNECVLNKMIFDCRRILGRTRITELLNEAIESTIINHPWASRVSLSDDLLTKTMLVDRIETPDLNAIYEALSAVIDHLTQSLTTKTKYETLGVAVKTAKKSCYEKWAPYLSGVVAL
jgi:hypothetical protein